MILQTFKTIENIQEQLSVPTVPLSPSTAQHMKALPLRAVPRALVILQTFKTIENIQETTHPGLSGNDLRCEQCLQNALESINNCDVVILVNHVKIQTLSSNHARAQFLKENHNL